MYYSQVTFIIPFKYTYYNVALTIFIYLNVALKKNLTINRLNCDSYMSAKSQVDENPI